MEELGFDGSNNVLLIVLAELAKIVNGFWREDNVKHREPHVQHDRARRVCCLEYIILSDVRFCRVHGCQEPNARGEPPPEAGAQRTLEAVGSTALFGQAFAATSAYALTQ
jgi:hypothetical protein